MRPSGSPQVWSRRDLGALALLAALAAALRLYFYSGLSGSDDTVYAIRGLETSLGLWLPSDYVGDLRYGVNLPIAAFVTLLGRNMAGLHAWAFACSLGEIVLVYVLARRLWGLPSAVLAGLALSLAPLHIHAGGRALADAPLAFFFTLAFVSFYFAERDRRVAWYWIAGLAIGFSWWIKPHAIVFCLAFLGYAALSRTWRRQWWLVVLGAAGAVALELGMFQWAFGDPLYALKAMVQGINKNFVKQDAPWGDHAPFFYFRQMFLDGRDMGLMPFLALLGTAGILRQHRDRSLSAGGFALFWAATLLIIFSFMPFSFSPFKLIPKQENYALMFLAPIGLLAGRGLALMRPLPFAASGVAAMTILALAFAALPQFQVQAKVATLRAPAEFVATHPGAMVFGPDHLLNLERAGALLRGDTRRPAQLMPLRLLLETGQLPDRPPGRVFVFLHPTWPEVVKAGSVEAVERQLGCFVPAGDFPPKLDTEAYRAVRTLDAFRLMLPAFIGKHLAFTQRMLSLKPTRALEWPPDCRPTTR